MIPFEFVEYFQSKEPFIRTCFCNLRFQSAPHAQSKQEKKSNGLKAEIKSENDQEHARQK
jgi:hypothetical protein